MIVFLLSLVIIALVILGLAAGLLLGRGPLQGSCGGDAVIKACPVCPRRED